MRRGRDGWTLFELLLVLAVLVVVAAVATPSLQSMYGDVRVRSAADAIRAAWARARAAAIDHGSAYRFCMIPNTGSYRIDPDNADASASANSADRENKPLVLKDDLPKGVIMSFSAGSSGAAASSPENGAAAGTADVGQYVTVVVFLPDGTAREDVRLVLTTRGARPLVMKLRALTGGVRTERLNPDRQGP
jgi:prepilin-type N-terminal cleavage/methylation domain-containing protein